MSFWVVVTPQPSPALRKLVNRVVHVERLPGGQFLSTVEASDEVMEALAEASEGCISVERCGFIVEDALLAS